MQLGNIQKENEELNKTTYSTSYVVVSVRWLKTDKNGTACFGEETARINTTTLRKCPQFEFWQIWFFCIWKTNCGR
jgi:hypothetical protein